MELLGRDERADGDLNLIGLLLLSGLIARETRFYLQHDPKLEANAAEIEAFMQGQSSWEEWKRGEERQA